MNLFLSLICKSLILSSWASLSGSCVTIPCLKIKNDHINLLNQCRYSALCHLRSLHQSFFKYLHLVFLNLHFAEVDRINNVKKTSTATALSFSLFPAKKLKVWPDYRRSFHWTVSNMPFRCFRVSSSVFCLW